MVTITGIGLFADTERTWFLPRIVGIPRAAEVIFTREFIEADEPERLGTLNGPMPAAKLEQETLILPRKIA
jgi:2-(1,2-epoxy-1,2-dihydrophenyl)acetyl-CoA isomerase